jgi:glycosyltransferase involved in cell wall biosynthesis
MRKSELTIGFPVYNGGSQLSVAIDSLLSQSFRDFVLIISDNGSSDDTSSICQKAAAHDSRIVYVRQPKNIGAFANFKFVLQQATSPYFMWAAHDDCWDPLFIEKNLALLNADPRAVASISRVDFHHDGFFVKPSVSTFPMQGSVKENLRRFWSFPDDCSRFYSIHRTGVIRECFLLDNHENRKDRREPAIELDEEPAVVVREASPAFQLASQDDQLMSKHCILRLKPDVRLEWRGQHGQNEADQRDHRANLAGSIIR